MRATVAETPASSIEVVHGLLGSELAGELTAFWAEQASLAEDEARGRPDEVVCVVRRDGALAGASSVYPEAVPLIGGRRFWIYGRVLTDAAAAHELELMAATFRTLESAYDGEPETPVGLCLLAPEAERRRLPPEADWSDPRMIYAGYLEDGRQVRISYFFGASIFSGPPMTDPGWELEARYRVAAFDEQDVVSEDDVIALWLREAGLTSEEAHRRAEELLVVATDTAGRLVGVSTAYLRHNDQIRADLWHFRAFVATAHRGSRIAIALAVSGRDRLDRRFAGGEDRRGIGMMYAVQSPFLKRAYPTGEWPWVDFHFIGENARGDDIRVHYFPGALAPEVEPEVE